MSERLPKGAESLGGKPIAEYKGMASLPVVLIGLAIVWGVIGLGLVIWSLLASRSDSSLLCWVPPGLICLSFGVWAINEWRLKHNLRVLVFPDGLVHIRGGRANVFRWDEITQVYQSLQKTHRAGRAIQRIYTVKNAAGKKSVLTGELAGIAALGETVQREITARLLPRSWEDYNAGRTLNFGKLGLSKEGIRKGKEVLPWDQVESVKLDMGSIVIKKEGGRLSWASITARSTPNLFVFLSMVDKIVGLEK
jgi:hypothetical protein